MTVLTGNTIEREQWNTVVRSVARPSFLQSWEWGVLQEREGRLVERFLLEDDTGLLGGQAILYELPFGRTYCYLPHGPVARWEENNTSVARLLEAVRAWARKRNAVFVRIDPVAEDGAATTALRTALQEQCQLQTAPTSVARSAVTAPVAVAVLDIAGTDDDVLARMKSKTRYNIRLADRRSVETRIITAENALAGGALVRFLNLLEQTAERAGFATHPSARYEHVLSVLRDDAFIVEAWHDDTLLASLLIVAWGGTATYLHGGSSREKSEHMGTYAAQWAAIEEARRRGCLRYDFGAIARRGDKDEDFSGLTRFKRGFGAEAMYYGLPLDDVLSRGWYTAYTLAKRIT